MSGNHFESQIEAQMKALSYNSEDCAQRLNHIVSRSKAATYERVIDNAYEDYRKHNIDMESLMQICNSRMSALYGDEAGIQSAILWLDENPESHYTAAYNERAGGAYRQILSYWTKDHEQIYRIAENLDTGIFFYIEDGKVYMIRNMMHSFHKIATLVILLNTDYCFGNLPMQTEDMDVTVQLDDTFFVQQGERLRWKDVMGGEKHGIQGYFWRQDKLGMYNVEKENDYTLTVMAVQNNTTAMTPFYGYRFILAGMLILLIPLMLLILKLFQQYFAEPIEVLVKGADEIENGNLGYQIEEIPETAELAYLTESMNEMSKQLKYQFDHIYEEEIALRDAKIMALQSHINPHFMNNTLEIINWEARMNGDQKVSEMIEALATLMDAGIDRKREPEVCLSEEMNYVYAYLDILKLRMGKRLKVIDELPEEIMIYKVPRLILQPIIENAVEHGAAKNGTGMVIMRGYTQGEYLYLDIYNDGGMTEEEAAKVERLLAPDYDTSKESSGNMGIANVNQRLRILYGEPCGLTIQNVKDEQVLTRLMIRI